MSYRQALLGRWSRGDWLAIAVVALAVAFVTGSGLAVEAATTETATVAADQASPAAVTWYDSPQAARGATGADALVVPVARVRVDGTTATVVGLPPDAAAFGNRTGLPLADPPPDGVVRHVSAAGDRRLDGRDGTAAVTVRSGDDPLLSPRWYVASAALVGDLGATGALALTPADGTSPNGGGTAAGTPVRGALAFFLAGANTTLRLLGLVTAGAAVLLGVAVFGVARIAVRDRRRTIRVLRATGAPPRTVVGLFALRAAIQTTVGVALGYALGMILTNAATSVAVVTGQPVSLSPRVTGRLAGTLAASYAGLVGVGALGGALAAWPTVRVPPAAVDEAAGSSAAADDHPSSTGESDGGGWLARLRPTLLGWRAVLPTATTLAVFVAFAVVAASTYGVLAPLSTGTGATVTEPGVAHPIASDVRADYAATLRDRDVAASAEILLLSVRDGRPFLARGADFRAFATVSDGRLLRGRPPDGPDEAVVGVDYARTFGVNVGDRVLLGGSTTLAVDRVRVVGVYDAREPFDDQLVVPLSTARHLAGKRAGTAHLVRVDRLPRGTPRISVVGVDVPRRVPAGESLSVNVTVANPTATERTRTVDVRFGDRSRAVTATLSPGERRTLTVTFPAGSPRNGTVSVGNRSREVRIVDGDTLVIERLPAVAPPDSAPLIRVVTAAGEPVGNVTVAVGGGTATTGSDGQVRVPLPAVDVTKAVTVTASKGGRTATASVTVDPDATRHLLGTLSVAPSRPTAVTTPTAELDVANPWNRTITRTVTVEGPGGAETRRVELSPGDRTTVSVPLSRQPPGTYTVEAEATTRLASARYRVVGDARLSAALAATGRDAPATGIGQAARVLFGNLELLLAVLLLLAGATTAGATTAAFAGAVHARRRTLGVHRAVGASPGAVLRLVLSDAAVVAVVATLLALVVAGGALAVLAHAGLLTVYGVRLLSTVSPAAVAAVAGAALVLAVIGAAGATWGVVRAPPSVLLAEHRRSRPAAEESRHGRSASGKVADREGDDG